MSRSSAPWVGLSLMLGDAFHDAVRPLFDGDEVDVVEWTFDMGWGRPLPAWLEATLDEFSSRGRLLGHGVSYSVLDASLTDRQPRWLHHLQVELQRRRYHHLSEHFGLMGGGNFHLSSPLPIPLSDTAVEVGNSRLRDLARVARLPVGLENLALAFSPGDVQQQGEFLERLLAPVDGFLLLDLHNLYCQAMNFNVLLEELVDSYPLDRVRELHLSGGSWSQPLSHARPVRRDTHDDRVPEELFQILPTVLRRCPRVEAVILERMDGTIDSANLSDAANFRADYRRLRAITREAV
ncbi:MAG: DUF692 family protein [Pirellulaceae bacterium]